MNGYSNYYPVQQTTAQVPYYYQLNEVLYPDFQTYPTAQDTSSGYQVYNYDPYSYVANNQNGYHVYKPITTSASNIQTTETVKVQESGDLESVLRKNPEVWEAYKTGNFDVEEVIEKGARRIILKEKGKSNKDYEYTVKKYKVNVQNTTHSRVVSQEQENDDHLLLVSYSSNSLNRNQIQPQKVVSAVASPALSYNPVVEQKQVIQYQPTPQPQQPQQVVQYQPQQQMVQYQQPAAQYHVQPQYVYQELPQNQLAIPTATGNTYYQPSITGPGSDLIQKLIDGDDEDFEYVVPEVHELVGTYLIYPKQNKIRTETPKEARKKVESDAVFTDSESDDEVQQKPRRRSSSSSSSDEYRSESRDGERSVSRSASDARSDSRNSNVSNNSRPIIRVNKTEDIGEKTRSNDSRLSALNYSPGVDSVNSPNFDSRKNYISRRK